MQVLQKNRMRFLQEMNARALVKTLRVMNLIPETVVHSISISTNEEECNNKLLTHLKEDASAEQVLKVFKVASEETAYTKMREFATDVLKRLQ